LTLRNIFRIVRRDTLTLLTNLIGLSLGLAATILLTVFIQFELSFDRHFTHADRIYRLNTIWAREDGSSEMPINLRQAYTEIPEKVAGIEAAIQLYRGFNVEVTEGENRHKELGLLYSDPDFFKIFDLKMLAGDPESALKEPNVAVLTEKTAIRIFGHADVLGRTHNGGSFIHRIGACAGHPSQHPFFLRYVDSHESGQLSGSTGGT